MSGLYALLVLGIWAGLTALIVRGWRRLLAREDVPKLRVHAVFVPLLACWLGVTFWYGGGRKVYYDTLVNRMCKQDGGVKVYETVKLPADRFDKWGMVQPYDPTQKENALGAEYIYRSEDYFYRKGDPSMVRYRHQVLRRSDGKLLGETISYGRGGGDLLGPWHPSSYHCPPTSESSEIALFKMIFIPMGGRND